MERKKAVKRADLPDSPTGESLYCRKCGQCFSACRGDYFFMGGDEPMRHCGVNLVLVRRESRLVEVKA